MVQIEKLKTPENPESIKELEFVFAPLSDDSQELIGVPLEDDANKGKGFKEDVKTYVEEETKFINRKKQLDFLNKLTDFLTEQRYETGLEFYPDQVVYACLDAKVLVERGEWEIPSVPIAIMNEEAWVKEIQSGNPSLAKDACDGKDPVIAVLDRNKLRAMLPDNHPDSGYQSDGPHIGSFLRMVPLEEVHVDEPIYTHAKHMYDSKNPNLAVADALIATVQVKQPE
jgi:hypothetical protein